MPESTLVLDPVAPANSDIAINRSALDGLAGKVIGFIDNSKPNFQFLADDLASLLVQRYGVAEVVRQRKRSASMGAPDAILREIVERCDAVVTGSGD